jgi:hypothetical protein
LGGLGVPRLVQLVRAWAHPNPAMNETQDRKTRNPGYRERLRTGHPNRASPICVRCVCVCDTGPSCTRQRKCRLGVTQHGTTHIYTHTHQHASRWASRRLTKSTRRLQETRPNNPRSPGPSKSRKPGSIARPLTSGRPWERAPKQPRRPREPGGARVHSKAEGEEDDEEGPMSPNSAARLESEWVQPRRDTIMTQKTTVGAAVTPLEGESISMCTETSPRVRQCSQWLST